MSREAAPGVAGGMSWAATYNYDCVLDDTRKVETHDQQRRDKAAARLLQQTNRARGSGQSSNPVPGSLFDPTLL